MNCKQGDLAVLVRSKAGNEGRIVRVLAYLGVEPSFGGYISWGEGAGACWLVESEGSPLTDIHGKAFRECPAPDAWLRPIRPDEEPKDT